MSQNGSGPETSTAVVEGGARKDQLDGCTSENNAPANANQARLISSIKAHIARGDKAAKKAKDHYIAAGQYLATLKKEHGGTWTEWEELLKTKVGISTGRASELMQIADGRKTVEELRGADAQKHKRLRDQRRSSGRREEDADEPEASAEKDATPQAPEADKAARVIDGDNLKPGDVDLLVYGEPAVAALRMVEQMSEEDRERFFEGLEKRYCYRAIYKDDSPDEIAEKIVDAIGDERARGEAEKIGRDIKETAGKPPLPDCLNCKGSGLAEVEGYGGSLNIPCPCTHRKSDERFRAKQREEQAAHEAFVKEMQQPFSFGVEAATKDGRVWSNGVRLRTKEEAELYVEHYARHELKGHGYAAWDDDPDHPCEVVFDIKRYDQPPVMWITRPKGRKRPVFNFPHGTCGLMEWHPINKDAPPNADDGLDIPDCLRRAPVTP